MDMVRFFAMVAGGGGLNGSGVARVFFVQRAGGESKGYEAFRSLVDRDAETSYAPK